MQPSDVVITGIGLVSPIGIGRADFCRALGEGRSGIGRIAALDAMGPRGQIGGEVHGFDPRRYVANRKGLKLMSRNAQMALAATRLAWQEAGLALGRADPSASASCWGPTASTTTCTTRPTSTARAWWTAASTFRCGARGPMRPRIPWTCCGCCPTWRPRTFDQVRRPGTEQSLHGGELSGLQAVIEAAAVIQARHGRRDDRRRHEFANDARGFHAPHGHRVRGHCRRRPQ